MVFNVLKCDNCDRDIIKFKDYFYNIFKERLILGGRKTPIISSNVNNKILCGLCYYNLINGLGEGEIKDIPITKRDVNLSIVITILFMISSLVSFFLIDNGKLMITGLLFILTLMYLCQTISFSNKLFLDKNV